MMAQQYEVESTTGKCAATGRPFQEGDEFYTVLLEEGETFARRDYCVESWQGPPDGAFCFFKTRVPRKEPRKKLLVDNEILIGFFERLAEETEPVRLQFRFVVALILMRKRLLRYEGSTVEERGEVWTMTLMRDRSEHTVINPCLSDDQIETVSRELGAILHSDMGEWTLDPDDGPEQAPEQATDPSGGAGE